MKLQRKGTRHSHRGVIGVESAIVMIAFVIVAAALAFVVLNMGFSTSQKAKTVTFTSLRESSSVLEVSGTILGIGCMTLSAGCFDQQKINATSIPLKVAAGGYSVNLSSDLTVVRYIGKSIEISNIYAGPITANTFIQLVSAFDQADIESDSDFDAFNDANPVNGTLPSETAAFIYWSKRLNDNAILDLGEHAILAIGFTVNEQPLPLEKISIEIIIANGATLSVERVVPIITTPTIVLG